MTKRLEIIDIPIEHAGVVDVAWKRIQVIAFGAPIILDVWKQLLVSIYLQGVVDGTNACERKVSDETERNKRR